MSTVFTGLFVLSALLIVYHHALFPLLQRLLTRRRLVVAERRLRERYEAMLVRSVLPQVTIIVPAHNEADFIAEKIRNLAILDYPAHRLQVVIACDGCSDDTAAIARRTAAEPGCAHLNLRVDEHAQNRGKTAVLNETIGRVTHGIVGLSDTSALLSIDALWLAVGHFAERGVGVVAAGYALFESWEKSELAYWKYQAAIKQRESLMGSVLGAHGAFYLFHRRLWTPLEADTVNDDFVLPMRIVALGQRAVYEPRMSAIELEVGDPRLEAHRRRRIASGNAQQLMRLAPLLLPRHGAVAFNFFSGKALRTLMPLCLLLAFASNWMLASLHPLLLASAIAQSAVYVWALLANVAGLRPRGRIARALLYLVNGHWAGLLGLGDFLLRRGGRWQRAVVSSVRASDGYVHPLTRIGKRFFDIAVASLGLVASAPLWPLIAVAIRIDSRGPILFRQLRVGRFLPDRVELFHMIKFRTMRNDAESDGRARWASVDDPRITRVGMFLRKTRLDEIPQLLNVLLGEMSIVGPRPERPGFYSRLEQEIPYYAERTYGVLPGITGLAQVRQGYDSSIEDVRSKVGYDHAYSLALANPWSWLKWDARIAFETFFVMLFGRGR